MSLSKLNVKQREATRRNGDRQEVWCRLSARPVSGRRSTAAETYENEAELLWNAPNNLFLVLSRFEASSTEALCSAVLRSPSVQGQRRKGAETTIPTHNIDAITNLFGKGGAGLSVQPCRRKAVRRSGPRHVCRARSVVCNSKVPQRFLSTQPR
jgi:hypothetical protein